MTEKLCVGCGAETVDLVDPHTPTKFEILEVCELCQAKEEADQEGFKPSPSAA